MPSYYSSPRSSRRSRYSSRNFSFTEMLILSKVLRFALIGLVALIIIGFLYVIWVSRDLPTPGKLSNPQIHNSTQILDKNGLVLYSIYQQFDRLYIPLSQIPQNLQNGTIATEDQTFYQNQGFDPLAYLRVLKDFLLHQEVTGGSTITQQLVKTVLLGSERSITRKAKELVLSVQVDQKYSKQQILEMYLNNISYGGTAVGVEAGAELYFNKHAKDLDLAQSAFLAGLPQAPSYYSPYGTDPGAKAYIDRTQHVLDRMKSVGDITDAQETAAMKEVKGFTFSVQQGDLKAPHFVMYVKQQLIDMFGEQMVDTGNLTVQTTLDYNIEQQAENIVNKNIAELKNYHVTNGAAVVMDPKTDAILAMVGSENYFDTANQGNFNAVLALRQPGSSLKPITYAVAFTKGYTPATMLMDVPTNFTTGLPQDGAPYSPVNYSGKFLGPMQLRFALGNSENIPAVKLLALVGIQAVMQQAYNMGITNWQPTQQNMNDVGLSLVLGGRETTLLQEATAYSVFADQGIKQEPYTIEKVTDSTGEVLYQHQNSQGQKVLSSEVSFLISHILSDDNARQPEFGRNSWLVVPGKTVAVKTGTTDDKRDNWALGYTPSYTVGVWVGNNDNSPMNQAISSGETGASPIWNEIMQAVLKGKSDQAFQKPDDVNAMVIDSLGGGLPVSGQPTRAEYFIKGTEPTAPSPIYVNVKMSHHDNGKLASDDEAKCGDYDTKQFIEFQETDPVSKDGQNRWQQGIDAWVHTTYSAANPQYYPPTDKSSYSESCSNPSAVETNPTPLPTPTPTPGS